MSMSPELLWRVINPQKAPTTASADVFSNIKSLVSSCSHWQTVETSATGTNSVLLQPTVPVSGSGGMYLVLAHNITASSAYQSPHTNASALTSLTIGLFVGSGSFNGPQADFPFQPVSAGSRWSKYVYLSPITTLSQSFLIESPEVLMVGSRHFGTPATHGAFAGAVMESFDSGTGEADGRLFGMLTSGLIAIQTTFMAGATSGGWLSHNATTTNAVAGVFAVSGNVPTDVWSLTPRVVIYSTVAGSMVVENGANDTLVSHQLMFEVQSTRAVGWLRGVYGTNNQRCLERIVSGGVDVAVCLGALTTSINNAVLLPLSGSGLSLRSPW